MQLEEVKLKNVADILIGLPVSRYIDYEDGTSKEVIANKSIEEIDEDFEAEKVRISKIIKDQFISKKQDILYKVQQQSFAKEITTETGLIIPNTYIIIRVDNEKVNPTFLAYYLNDPRVEYEIQKYIDSPTIMKVSVSILKELNIQLPYIEIQNKYANIINKINLRIKEKKKSIECDEEIINSLYNKVIGDYYVW